MKKTIITWNDFNNVEQVEIEALENDYSIRIEFSDNGGAYVWTGTVYSDEGEELATACECYLDSLFECLADEYIYNAHFEDGYPLASVVVDSLHEFEEFAFNCLR